jgi:hypothetical protein
MKKKSFFEMGQRNGCQRPPGFAKASMKEKKRKKLFLKFTSRTQTIATLTLS